MSYNSYLASLIKQFEYYKMLGEKAMAQVSDEQLFYSYNEDSNSIAVIVQHISGNMLSRFTDFKTSDGEKPWRNRDHEFETHLSDRASLMAAWNRGWQCLLTTISGLDNGELEDIVYIRNDGHTVMEALNRQLAHYPYHVGQMVYIAKMLSSRHWQSLSIPKNRSVDYNDRKFGEDKGIRHFTDKL